MVLTGIVFMLRSRSALQFRRLLAEGIEEGSLEPCDLKMAAFVIGGALSWIGRWYQLGGEYTASVTTAPARCTCSSGPPRTLGDGESVQRVERARAVGGEASRNYVQRFVRVRVRLPRHISATAIGVCTCCCAAMAGSWPKRHTGNSAKNASVALYVAERKGGRDSV